MTIAIIIALLFMAACMGFMAYKLIQFESHESKADQVDKYAQRSVQISNGNFKALKDELERVGMQTAKNTDEISEIIDRMQKVIDDIARLDRQAMVDHNNLVDIRKRYVNYRIPTYKFVDDSPFLPSELEDPIHTSLKNFEEMRDA